MIPRIRQGRRPRTRKRDAHRGETHCQSRLEEGAGGGGTLPLPQEPDLLDASHPVSDPPSLLLSPSLCKPPHWFYLKEK